MYIYLKENGMSKESTIAAEKVNGNIHLKKSFVVTIDKPMEILYDAPKYIYCIEELPPPEIIPIDKAPSTTSLNDITNYINKTTESIKSCKSYIAYVINNKGGSATDTETLGSLINKLNDTFHFSPDEPPPPLDIIMKPSRLRLSAKFHEINYKLQEINNLLKVSSDNLKTIMDANNLMYKNSDKLINLIKNLNNKKSILVDGTTFYETIVSKIKGFDEIENIKFIESDKIDGINVSIDGNTKANKIDKTLYIQSNGSISGNENCQDMFTTIFLSLKTVDFENFYASNVTNMSYMFYEVNTLTNLLNFKDMNTKNVTNMTGMFQYCTSLQSINFNNMDLSNVTDMSSMFQNCTSLQSIDGFENIKLEKVNNYAAMFYKCNKLNGGITISNHSTLNYINMFYGCSTEPNTKFTVNYIDEETKKIAEQMVATKSPESNVILGTLVTQ